MTFYFYETPMCELYASRSRLLFFDGFLFKAKTKEEARKNLQPYINRADRRHWTVQYVENLLTAIFEE